MKKIREKRWSKVLTIKEKRPSPMYFDCSTILGGKIVRDYDKEYEGSFREEDLNNGYIEKMPTYNALIYSLYDLYTVGYSRRKKDIGSFSYRSTYYLLDSITTTERSGGELVEELSRFCGEGKAKEVAKMRNKDIFTDKLVIKGIRLLSRLRLVL